MLYVQHLTKNVNCFSLETSPAYLLKAKKRLVSALFMFVLYYDYLIYMHVFSECLHTQNTVYHGVLKVAK